jgi:hypothetical protein
MTALYELALLFILPHSTPSESIVLIVDLRECTAISYELTEPMLQG